MSRREILEEVAAGRLAPAEAARRLEQPATEARLVQVRAAYHAVEVVADPEVADLVVEDGTPHIRREGDALVVSDTEGSRFGPGQGTRRLALRVNPRLDLDAEVTGALLSVSGLTGGVRAVVQAGSAGLEGVSGALDLRVTSGSARVAGAPRAADWRVRGESASLEVVLEAGADATVSVAGRHSHVDALGSQTHAVVGSGARSIDIDAAFSSVVVRTS